MKNYLKGYSASLLIHGAVLFLFLWVTLDGEGKEQEILVVDFSSVTVGKQNEGGNLPGPAGPAEPAGPPAPPVPAAQPPAPELEAVKAPPKPKPKPKSEKPKKKAEKAPKPRPEREKRPEPRAVATAPPERLERAEPARPPLEEYPAPAAGPETGAGQPNASSGGTPEATGTPGKTGTGGGAGSGKGEGRGTGPGKGEGTKEGLAAGYVKANFNYILVRIKRHLDYPAQAKRMGMTGVSKFTFIIKKDGNIESLELYETSGHQLLDEAARKAILRAAPFPAPPVPARIIIPISFKLT